MNEIHCTVVGTVVSEVRTTVTKSGHRVASFRVVSNTRRFNRESARWEDLDTTFLGVSCWRSLAEHVAACISKGDPVVVTGRLRVREYVDSAGRAALAVEVEASSVGHDLSRGRSSFQRATRPAASEAPAEAAHEAGAVSAPEAPAA